MEHYDLRKETVTLCYLKMMELCICHDMGWAYSLQVEPQVPFISLMYKIYL